MSVPQYLKCPQCDHGSLELKVDAMLCPNCQESYPLLNGIPWLVKNPNETMAEWVVQKNIINGRFVKLIESVKNSSGTENRPITKKRLNRIMDARIKQKKFFQDILGPFPDVELGEFDLQHEPGTFIPKGQNLFAYEQNIQRDWGEVFQDEIAVNLEFLKTLAGSHVKPGMSLLTLGAGAGRISAELHMCWSASHSLITDINPYLLLTGNRILAGEIFELPEIAYPGSDLNHLTMIHKLQKPRHLDGKNIKFAFSDALRPNISPESFDVVFTPWFVDIVPEPFSQVTDRVNNMLKLGGTWVQYGPLAFSHPDPRNNLSHQEILEYLPELGFEVLADHYAQLPYLQTAIAPKQRSEKVYGFVAMKTKHRVAPKPFEYLPDWLLDSSKSVPSHKAFSTHLARETVFLELLKSIDGQTSIDQIADPIAKAENTDPLVIRLVVKRYLQRLFRQNS